MIPRAVCRIPISSNGKICHALFHGKKVRLAFLPSAFCSFHRINYFHQCTALPSTSSVNLSDDDQYLIHRGDFSGVAGHQKKNDQPQSPELAITRLRKQYETNFRVQGESFLKNILLPIENKDAEFIGTIKRSPERYLPFLFHICGSGMPDIVCESRQQIMDRMWKALLLNNVAIDISSFNSRLASMLENEFDFDPWKMLEEAEIELNLSPTIETFHSLSCQFAKKGDVGNIREIICNVAKAGLQVDATFNCSLLYGLAICGRFDEAEKLLEDTVSKFGENTRRQALSSYMKAAAARPDIEKLREILRRSVIYDSYTKKQTKRFVLCIPYTDIFEVIWILSKHGQSENDYQSLIHQILDYTSRKAGFFKHLFRETVRHIFHGHFFSALCLMEDMHRVKDCLDNQQKNHWSSHLMAQLCHRMVVSKTPLSTVKKIANRIIATFGDSVRFPDMLLLSAYMSRDLFYTDKYEYFSEIVDMIDLQRERIHLILPVLVGAPDLSSRLKVLFRCTTLGYTDVSQLDIRTLSRLLLNPLFESFYGKVDTGSVAVTNMSEVLNSYGIKSDIIWKLIYNWWQLKRNTSSNYNVLPEESSLRKWLQLNYGTVFEKNRLNSQNKQKSLETLKRCIASKSVADIHSFIRLYGLPDETSLESILHPLLEVYINSRDLKMTNEMLLVLSTFCKRNEVPIKEEIILWLLAAQSGQSHCIFSVTEYAFELRRMFPNVAGGFRNFFRNQMAVIDILRSSYDIETLSVEHIDQSLNFIKILLKFDLCSLPQDEFISDYVINTALKRISWREAFMTWMKFQSSLNCSNGIIRLLRSAYISGTLDSVEDVLRSAKTFLSTSRIHAINAAVLIILKRFPEAEDIFKFNEISAYDVTSAFRLLNSSRITQFEEMNMIKFTELSLKYTGLAKDRKCCDKYHSLWIRLCEVLKLPRTALEMYSIFRKYECSINPTGLQKILKISDGYIERLGRRVSLSNGLVGSRIDRDFEKLKEINLQLHQEVDLTQDDISSDVACECEVEETQ
ncbi:hypothetical protein AB6A40_006068 [Gnathostoma spinigerum]|uniref:Pentatricopeptide repeat-containing protein n=1 Tax=Gnathostoma spinigerum TaxID=75299 RepID=A0ABD6EMI2_9BILA